MKFNQNIQLILVGVVSILGTVLVLHGNGYLKHSSEQDALYIAEFSLIANVPGASQVVSSKPSEFVARCTQGYLVMQSDKKTKNLSGVVVDQKKRPVTCLP